MEALIASNLEPAAFASYMAIGARKGSAEALVFVQVNEAVGDFNWDAAREMCVPHPDGKPKHSLYLSIYRVLERIPLEALGSLYLVTRDGRSLELKREEWGGDQAAQPENWTGVGLYKELCPVLPLVVSSQKPAEFGAFMTDPTTRTHVPSLMFTDLRIAADLDDPQPTASGERVYEQNPEHLKVCVEQVKTSGNKEAKIVDRTYFNKFSYALINSGVFLSRGSQLLFWRMPGIQSIKENSYDWGRSADMF
jgi:hypothetical protein